MTATATATATWPTIEAADAFVEQLNAAYNAVDEMVVGVYGLIDEADPYEQVEGRPDPTLADVAALTRIVQGLKSHLGYASDTMRDDWLPRLEQLLESASLFEADSRRRIEPEAEAVAS